MNKNYTLKELADIAKAAAEKANKESQEVQWGAVMAKADRPGFIWSETVKAVLDAIGYEFPKDEEREAFDAWYENAQISKSHNIQAFEIWKAGRDELRRDLAKDEEEPLQETKEPAWIPWDGGECPLTNKVRKWEARMRNGMIGEAFGNGTHVNWSHSSDPLDIVEYRILEMWR